MRAVKDDGQEQRAWEPSPEMIREGLAGFTAATSRIEVRLWDVTGPDPGCAWVTVFFVLMALELGAGWVHDDGNWLALVMAIVSGWIAVAGLVCLLPVRSFTRRRSEVSCGADHDRLTIMVDGRTARVPWRDIETVEDCADALVLRLVGGRCVRLPKRREFDPLIVTAKCVASARAEHDEELLARMEHGLSLAERAESADLGLTRSDAP